MIEDIYLFVLTLVLSTKWEQEVEEHRKARMKGEGKKRGDNPFDKRRKVEEGRTSSAEWRQFWGGDYHILPSTLPDIVDTALLQDH